MTTTALFIHDLEGYSESVAKNISLKNKVPTRGIATAREALEIIKGGVREIDCVVIHKDLGERSGEGSGLVDQVVKAIHEAAPTVRIGIVSGEYPHGKEHVLKLGADFYMSTNHVQYSRDWLVEQMTLGPVLPQEMILRGREIITPYSRRSSALEQSS